MRFVDDEGLRTGQDFAETFLFERQIGQQQVVIDHHQIGRLRTLARLHHEALAVERAVGAQAIVDGGGHHRQQRRVVRQGFQLGHVAELGAPAPGHDALELRDLFGRGKARFATCLLGAVLAQVVGAPLQQRTAQPHAQRGAHTR